MSGPAFFPEGEMLSKWEAKGHPLGRLKTIQAEGQKPSKTIKHVCQNAIETSDQGVTEISSRDVTVISD